ncbi:MAG: hypothetical protein WC822_04040, partial [Candidatus Paceibacterota bacterium]
MESEIKNCQNCKNDFVIESEDFNFYEKIKVPPPTFCPECRLIRRLNFRNERTFYKRRCDLCKKSIISVYNADSILNVYCHECWWGDGWDSMIFKSEYDFTKPALKQFQDLLQKVPVVSLFVGGNQINSDYCNFTADNKNCYLCFGGKANEQILYANRSSLSKECVDIYNGTNLELCYESIQCEKSYKLFFCIQCENCNDSMFLYDCRNCQNCFGCTNLRNKTYCIFNQQYKREEYLEKIKEFNLGNFNNLEFFKNKFFELCKKSIHKYAHLINSQNSTGDYLFNVKNCQNCFDLTGSVSENCKYTHFAVFGMKDSYDNYGSSKAEKVYETLAIGFDSNENSDYFFSYFIRGSTNIFYSYNCVSCHDLFLCIGLRNKSYCILNEALPDDIKDITTTIVGKVIECNHKGTCNEQCTEAFKIIPEELSFYQR